MKTLTFLAVATCLILLILLDKPIGADSANLGSVEEKKIQLSRRDDDWDGDDKLDDDDFNYSQYRGPYYAKDKKGRKYRLIECQDDEPYYAVDKKPLYGDDDDDDDDDGWDSWHEPDENGHKRGDDDDDDDDDDRRKRRDDKSKHGKYHYTTYYDENRKPYIKCKKNIPYTKPGKRLYGKGFYDY